MENLLVSSLIFINISLITIRYRVRSGLVNTRKSQVEFTFWEIYVYQASCAGGIPHSRFDVHFEISFTTQQNKLLLPRTEKESGWFIM